MKLLENNAVRFAKRCIIFISHRERRFIGFISKCPDWGNVDLKAIENGSFVMIFVKVDPHFLLVSNKVAKKNRTLTLQCLRFPPLLQIEKNSESYESSSTKFCAGDF